MLRIVELRVAQGPIPTRSLILIGICSASAAWCSSPGFFRADTQSRASGSSLRADRDLQDSWHTSSPLPGAGSAREGWWHGTRCLWSDRQAESHFLGSGWPILGGSDLLVP